MVSIPLKNTGQNGNLPQIGVKIKNLKPRPPPKLSLLLLYDEEYHSELITMIITLQEISTYPTVHGKFGSNHRRKKMPPSRGICYLPVELAPENKGFPKGKAGTSKQHFSGGFCYAFAVGFRDFRFLSHCSNLVGISILNKC